MIAVLDEMQIFDQEIGAARLAAQQISDLLLRIGVDLPSLGEGAGPLA
jgi:hypothetical protein